MLSKVSILTLMLEIMIQILNLKLVIKQEYENIKYIFATGFTPNWSENVFVIKKFKHTASWTNIISDLSDESVVRQFYEKELENTNIIYDCSTK